MIWDAGVALRDAKLRGLNHIVDATGTAHEHAWTRSRLCAMGLLDDAIREHLDLKRRRGADPTEIERAEREALGPVRRAPAEPGEADLHEDRPEEPSVAYNHEDDPDWDEPFEDGEHERHHPEDDFEYDELEEADAETALPPESHGWDHEDAAARGAEEREPEFDDEPPPREASSARPHPSEDAGEETVEYEVDSEHEHEHERGDMLQETPEFLQDTPDHDRLWFEQRPPRDFDFDG